jgi:NAD(P)-dependent dehydrogenase (short-subunit alcohol dehydrogenase family)
VDVAGSTAIVTGSGAGIGEAIALRLARDGAAVVVADDDEDTGPATADEIVRAGGEASFILTDVTDEAAVERMVAHAESTFGPLGILVNNVGGYEEPVFPDSPIERWSGNIDLNLRSVMLGIHFAVRAMAERGGAIVNVASTAGLGFASHPWPEYAAGKAAVMRLTACLAHLAERTIRVNCICPFTVATAAVRGRIAELEAAGEELPGPLQAVLLELDEVAEAAVQLITDDSLAGRVVVLVGGREPELVPAESLP